MTSSPAKKADPLARVERVILVLGALVTAACGLVWGGRGMLGAGAGALLACANFFAIRRLGRRAVDTATAAAEGGRSSVAAVALTLGLIGKMAALFALVWIAIKVLHLPVLPFTLGISVFVVALLAAGTRQKNDADVGEDARGAEV